MQAYTHAAVGTTIGLLATVTQPKEVITVGVASALVGAIICDIDVGDTGKKITPIIISSISILVGALVVLLGYYFQPRILDRWQKSSDILLSLLGLLLFILVCYFGSKKRHRSFMHSILGMCLLGIGIALMYPTACIYFIVGYLSHIFLDMLNYRPVLLFYPMEKGYSFKCFYSKSKGNLVFFFVNCICIILLLCYVLM